MNPLRILYLGRKDGTSLHRADAFRRLGHIVEHIDPREFLPGSIWIDRLVWHVGGATVSGRVLRGLECRLNSKQFELCHVDAGECVTPRVIKLLRRHCGVIVNFNVDDPFGPRDGRRFSAYRDAVPEYDLIAVCRALNVPEAHALGAKKVVCVFRSADEIEHAPVRMSEADLARWGSDVLFLGTWMPERGPFLLKLLRLGIPLSIRGSGWERAAEWPELSTAYRGPNVQGVDYVRAIQGAKINLGLLSKGNRDLHTTRSAEIPALGALFCAERTPEHEAMYREGLEAVFWSDATECADVCEALLKDEARRSSVAAAGRRRVQANGHFNEPTMQAILAAAGLAPDMAASARNVQPPSLIRA